MATTNLDSLELNKEVVRKGYNTIAQGYHRTREQYKKNQKELEMVRRLLPDSARILDVGCGSGVPISAYFVSTNCKVTGIDISVEMLKLARQNVPSADFIEMDMCDSNFPDEEFDGITAIYSFFHVPKEKQGALLQNFYRMLKKKWRLVFLYQPHRRRLS